MTLVHDRQSDDVGNIVMLEHANVTVPDIELAALFYVHALGFTRDPYIDLGPDLMWINVGHQQIHLPRGGQQKLRGQIIAVVQNVEALTRRLKELAPRFGDTQFAYATDGNTVDVCGPWGNRFRCVESEPGARMELGLSGIEFVVPVGTSSGIGRFYEAAFGALVERESGSCSVSAGPGQQLRFRESSQPLEEYDGHHIAIYISGFSDPHRWLREQGLLMDDTAAHEYRFNWIVDPDSGEKLFELEHEVRSLHHALYRRPLVNRNAEQDLAAYAPGLDPFAARRRPVVQQSA